MMPDWTPTWGTTLTWASAAVPRANRPRAARRERLIMNGSSVRDVDAGGVSAHDRVVRAVVHLIVTIEDDERGHVARSHGGGADGVLEAQVAGHGDAIRRAGH